MILQIDDKRLDFFNSVTVDLLYDSVASSFGFDFPYDPTKHKELFKSLSYKRAKVIFENETLITGTVINDTKTDQSQKALANVSGYSLPGVLEDCTVPISSYPLQSDGLSCKQIAEKLLAPFGIGLIISSSVASKMDEVLEVSTSDEKQTIKGYLSEICSQKDVIITHTAGGALLFTKPNTGSAPKAHFEPGKTIATRYTLSNNGQQLHSSITVIKQADIDGGNAGESTVSNPLIGQLRPLVKVQDSGTDNDSEQAGRNARSAELKSISLTIEVTGWKVNGVLLKPGDIVTVRNPNIGLFIKNRWFVDAISYKGDEKGKAASIKLVLPSVYDGTTPANIYE